MDPRKRFTAFISKYALTTGIKIIAAEACETPGMIADTENRWRSYYHGEGREWHRTREAAVARAEELRVAKIASLKKQITKLENLRFE